MTDRLASLPRVARGPLWATALALMLCSVTTVQAGVVGSWSLAADPLAGMNFTGDTGLNDPSQNWVAYNFSVASDDGALIQAIEVGLGGLFHQRWNTDLDLADTAATPSGQSLTSGDSHLLLGSSALVASAAYEDNDVRNTNSYAAPLADTGTYHYGVGSELRSAWGIPYVDEKTSFNVAHLVVPRGIDLSTYRLNVAVATESGIYDLSGCNFAAGSCSFGNRPEPPRIEVPVVVPPPHVPDPVFPSPPEDPTANLPPVHPVVPGVTPPILPQPSPGSNQPQHPAPSAPNLYAWATRMLTTTENPLPPGFTAFQLNISSENGSTIGAIDMSVNGPLHQRWTDADGDGVNDPTTRGLATTGYDSHLLIPENGLPIQLNENNGVSPSPLTDGASGTGVGSSLSGVWGLVNQTPTAQLAYLVVPESMDFHDLDIRVGAASGTGEMFATLSAKNFNVLNPDGSLIRAAEPIIPATSEPVPPPTGEPQSPTIGEIITDPPIIITTPPIAGDPPTGTIEGPDPGLPAPPDLTESIGLPKGILVYRIDEDGNNQPVRIMPLPWRDVIVLPFDGVVTIDEGMKLYALGVPNSIIAEDGATVVMPISLRMVVTNDGGNSFSRLVDSRGVRAAGAVQFSDFSLAAADSQTVRAPEPGSLVLLGLAFVSWLGCGRRHR